MVWAIALTSTLALACLLIWAQRLENARADARHRAWLRALPAQELASEVRRLAVFAGLEEFQTVQELAQDLPWTDVLLLEKLEALLAAVSQKDLEAGRTGRDSHLFEFYDTGLATIREILSARANNPYGS